MFSLYFISYRDNRRARRVNYSVCERFSYLKEQVEVFGDFNQHLKLFNLFSWLWRTRVMINLITIVVSLIDICAVEAASRQAETNGLASLIFNMRWHVHCGFATIRTTTMYQDRFLFAIYTPQSGNGQQQHLIDSFIVFLSFHFFRLQMSSRARLISLLQLFHFNFK